MPVLGYVRFAPGYRFEEFAPRAFRLPKEVLPLLPIFSRLRRLLQGLYPFLNAAVKLFRAVEELAYAEHVPMVGHSNAGHSQLARTAEEVFEMAGTVEHRVLRVHVEMSKPEFIFHTNYFCIGHHGRTGFLAACAWAKVAIYLLAAVRHPVVGINGVANPSECERFALRVGRV